MVSMRSLIGITRCRDVNPTAVLSQLVIRCYDQLRVLGFIPTTLLTLAGSMIEP